MSAQDECSSRESSVEVPMMSPAADGSSPGNKARSSAGRSTGSVRYLRACDNCRRRKVKCDGVRPSCGHCNRVEVPCHYSIKPKSRRMWKCLEDPDGTPATLSASAEARPSRASAPHTDGSQVDDTTAWLMARVETMERLLMQRNIGSSPRIPQPMTLNDEGAAAQHGGMSTINPLKAVPPAIMSGTTGSTALRGLMMDIGNAQGINNGAPGNNGTYASGVPAKRDNEHLSADPGYPPQLANMLAPPPSHRSHTSSASGGSEGHNQHAPGLLSLEIIKHLIDTLFAHPNYIVEVLHEETFRRQFAAGTLSPLLLFSALGSAARYSKHPAVRTDPPYSASAVYINRARLLVIDAIEEPSLSNAQGLMIMCMMNFALGNETVTTFYKAMALNMCILLGFNRLDSIDGPVQPHANCGGNDHLAASTMAMDWVDREAARRLWWTMFSIENYSSVCMGLTPSIQAEYCDVHLPASTLEWEQGHPNNPATTATDAGNPAKRARLDGNPIHMLPAYHAQLSLIFSKVAWLVTRTNSSAEDAVAQFSELNSVLQRWYEGLPKELRLSSVDSLLFGHQDSSEYYHICVLHMRFYATVIQLNHAIPEFTDDPTVIEPGQRKCVIAASRISDLLRTSFEIPVELRDMNWYMCVFRAAHIHIYRLLSRDMESIARAKQDLAIHRRHLREGAPLWRICNKLMSRLDDMEQMVMLLPAQIPVADLIRLKNLTRKGKSQLVNMQLDALIKPNLIQTENGDSDDLPLLTRAEMAGNIQQRQKALARPSQQPRQQSLGAGDVQTSPLGLSMSSTATSLGGILDQSTSNASPLSTVLDGSSSSHSTLNPFTSMGSLASLQLNKGSPDVRFTTGSGGNGFTSSSSSPSLIMPALDHPHGKPMAIHHQQQHQQHSNSMLSGSLLPPPADLAPINTNIVIDNNMAETLVNYFYMVASNQSQQLQVSAQSGSANSLASPGMPMMSSAGLTIGGGVSGAMLPSLPSMMPLQPIQQQHQQQLFGH
ncbi:hypothetical protein H4S07_002415, partial [Coemansia furcata]